MRDEAQLYGRVHGQGSEAFGFRNGLLFRTDAAYAIFLRQIKALEDAYHVKIDVSAVDRP